MSDQPETKKARVDASSDHLTSLDYLKKLTVVVADTGEFDVIKNFSPQDATTNPSLIYKAANLPEYSHLIDDAVKYSSNIDNPIERLEITMDKLAVNFGVEISKIVPGYVSTEVDARLSFDTQATVARARRIIKMYEEQGVSKSRILIKIASTYEGIRAGEILEKEGIHCNLTLLFSLIQAAACAEAGITLISPFVGRILDWYKAKTGKAYSSVEDPGVVSVKEIFHYFKKFGYQTIVMGASFRNVGEILALAGCDRLTVAPSLLSELQNAHDEVMKALCSSESVTAYSGDKLATDEPNFRFQLNENAMATEKLSEGIRLFSADLIKLENIIKQKLQ